MRPFSFFANIDYARVLLIQLFHDAHDSARFERAMLLYGDDEFSAAAPAAGDVLQFP